MTISTHGAKMLQLPYIDSLGRLLDDAESPVVSTTLLRAVNNRSSLSSFDEIDASISASLLFLSSAIRVYDEGLRKEGKFATAKSESYSKVDCHSYIYRVRKP